MKQILKNFSNCLIFKIITMKKVISLLVIAVLLSLSACMKFELPQEKTTEQGSNKDTNDGNTDRNDKNKDESKPKPPTFATGVVRLSPEDYAKIPKAKFPATGDENLPDEFMLDYPKNNIPSQQAQGSCVAFSLCSALYVKLMHERMHIPYEDRSRYPSAAFIYNQSKYSDCETGTIVVKAINLLEDKGVCYEKDMPYDPNDCWRQPTKEQLEKGQHFRIKGFSRIEITPTAFARALTLGYPIIATADVSGKSFQEAFFNKGKIWNPMSVDRGESYHCVNIIGYDKNNKTFTIFNSWGDGANKGRVLMSEEAIRTHIVEAYILELFDTYSEDDADSQKDPLTVTPSSIDFGEIDDAKNLSDKPLIIKANKDITIKSLTVSDTKNFEVQSYESVLSAGTSKSLVVRAYPKEAGNLKANVVITYEVRGERKTLEVPLSVHSKKGEVPPEEKERIDLDKSELAFYNVVVGQQDRGIINLTLISGEDTNVSIQLSDEVNFQTLSKVYLYKNSRQTASIGVTYRPRSAGTHRAKLLLTSPNGFNKEVSLLGQAKQPEPEHDDIEIDTPNIDFGTIQLQQGSSVTKLKSFRVTNNNNQADVTLTLSSNTDAYTVSPEKVTISPRNTQTITVRLNVRGEGYYPGSIRVQSTRGYEERIQLSGQVVEQQRNDDRGDDNHRDHNDQDRRQEQARYRVEVVPVSTIRSGECSGLDKVTFTGKITGENSTVQQAANGDLIINIRIRKTDGGVYIRSGRFFIKYNSFCNLAIDRKGVAYEAGIYEITTSLRMSSDIVGRVIYLQTNADKLPNGEDGERNYCAIKVLKN